jgi:hypothetical protein
MPAPSASLTGLGPALAFLIAMSVSAIYFPIATGFRPKIPPHLGVPHWPSGNTPQSYPHKRMTDCERERTQAACLG